MRFPHRYYPANVTPSNDRLGKKIRVKCDPDDTIGDFKKLVAAQIGTAPEKVSTCQDGRMEDERLRRTLGAQIILKKWYSTFKDHITLADYEIGNGSSLEMYGLVTSLFPGTSADRL